MGGSTNLADAPLGTTASAHGRPTSRPVTNVGSLVASPSKQRRRAHSSRCGTLYVGANAHEGHVYTTAETRSKLMRPRH